MAIDVADLVTLDQVETLIERAVDEAVRDVRAELEGRIEDLRGELSDLRGEVDALDTDNSYARYEASMGQDL